MLLFRATRRRWLNIRMACFSHGIRHSALSPELRSETLYSGSPVYSSTARLSLFESTGKCLLRSSILWHHPTWLDGRSTTAPKYLLSYTPTSFKNLLPMYRKELRSFEAENVSMRYSFHRRPITAALTITLGSWLLSILWVASASLWPPPVRSHHCASDLPTTLGKIICRAFRFHSLVQGTGSARTFVLLYKASLDVHAVV